MQDKFCMHYYISGLVQGVCFRSFTQSEAKKLGMTGWVRNLPDGGVEVVACGRQEDIKTLEEWLRHGPSRAKVSDFTSEKKEWEDHTDFLIL